MSNFEDEVVSGTSPESVELAPESETGAAEVVAEGASTDATVETPVVDEAESGVSEEPSTAPSTNEPQAYQPTPSDGKPV